MRKNVAESKRQSKTYVEEEASQLQVSRKECGEERLRKTASWKNMKRRRENKDEKRQRRRERRSDLFLRFLQIRIISPRNFFFSLRTRKHILNANISDERVLRLVFCRGKMRKGGKRSDGETVDGESEETGERAWQHASVWHCVVSRD